MYKTHPKIETPDVSQVIWRYMDLWKFLDILDNSRIYLSQASQFEDKLDGRIPNHALKSAESDHLLKRVDDFAECFNNFLEGNCYFL